MKSFPKSALRQIIVPSIRNGYRKKSRHQPGMFLHKLLSLPISVVDPDSDPAFQVNPVPDPDTDPVFDFCDDQKLKRKIQQKIFCHLFLIKIAIYFVRSEQVQIHIKNRSCSTVPL
jgi:hypothetical protein